MNHNEFMQMIRKILTNNEDLKYFIQGIADGCNNEYKGLLKKIINNRINEYISEEMPIDTLGIKVEEFLNILCPKMSMQDKSAIVYYAQCKQEFLIAKEICNETLLEKGV